MDLKNKKVMLIDLYHLTFEVKTFADLNKHIGGFGLGIKLFQLYSKYDPLIFSIGPLNGFFPYASKTCVVLDNNGVVEDLYLGGSLGTRIRFAGLDAVIILGKSKEKIKVSVVNNYADFVSEQEDLWTLGLPGRRGQISFFGNTLLLDRYFTTPENFLEDQFKNKNLEGLIITGTEVYTPTNMENYKNLYEQLLNRKNEMTISQAQFPSCSNCPIGCSKSKDGEIGGNVLVHSLVACQFAEKIYSDIGIAFSCLNVLGYDYTHEDLENLPFLIENTIKEISI